MTGEIKSNEYNNGISNLPDIGSPIFCFTKSQCVLKENEIWLEGALVKIESYPSLFKEYGYDYTPEDVEAPPEGYFYLKDWRNRVPWGSPDGTLGYLKPTLPDHAHFYIAWSRLSYQSGKSIHAWCSKEGSVENYKTTLASNSNPIYQDGATVRPPSIKCRVKTRYR